MGSGSQMATWCVGEILNREVREYARSYDQLAKSSFSAWTVK